MGIIEQTYGPFVLGANVATLLYGASLVQTHLYHDRYSNDSRYIKGFVYTIFALDTLHVALIIWAVWYYVIESFGDDARLTQIAWPIIAEMFVTVTITFFVQAFQAWRVIVLTKRKLIPASIAFLSLVQYVFLIAFLAPLVGDNPKWTDSRVYTESWKITLSMSTQIAADLLIASTSFANLRAQRGGYEGTRSVLHKLTLYTMGTCLVPAVFAIVRLILFVAVRSFATLVFSMILAKVYSNCMFVSLNARKGLRNMLGDVHMDSLVAIHTGVSGGQAVVNVATQQGARVDNKIAEWNK